MFCRKKSTTQSCQPEQIDPLRTSSNFGLPRPHPVASDVCAPLVAQGAASFAGPEALFPVPKTLPEAKLRIISTCANRVCNYRRISPSVLLDLKLFRINTCRKWPTWATGANVIRHSDWRIRNFAPSTKYGQQSRALPRPASPQTSEMSKRLTLTL
jgi:hypothetical protein